MPHALVLYRDGKVESAALRGALERFNGGGRGRRLAMDRGGAGDAPPGRPVRDRAGGLLRAAASGRSRRGVTRTARGSAADGATTGVGSGRRAVSAGYKVG